MGFVWSGWLSSICFVARAVVSACLSPSTADEVRVHGRCPWLGLDACCLFLRRSRAGLGCSAVACARPSLLAKSLVRVAFSSNVLARVSCCPARAHAAVMRFLCIHRHVHVCACICQLTRPWVAPSLSPCFPSSPIPLLGLPLSHHSPDMPVRLGVRVCVDCGAAGTYDEVCAFAREKFGAAFTLFDPLSVNGPTTHPVYQWLKANNPDDGKRIEWNFAKFLVDADGAVVRRYKPGVLPEMIEGDVAALVAGRPLPKRVKPQLGAA